MNNTKKVFEGYQFKHYGDNKPIAVIFGESHSEPFETTLGRCFQENLIRTLKPKYVLTETLAKGDESKTLPERIKNNTCFRHWRDRHQCDLRPCDLSVQEMADKMREILNRYPKLLPGLENCRNPFEVINYYESCTNSLNRNKYPGLERLIFDAREIRMGEIIIEFSKEPSELVVAIIGDWHARCDSKIHETLKGHINYVCIWNEEWVEKDRKNKPWK